MDGMISSRGWDGYRELFNSASPVLGNGVTKTRHRPSRLRLAPPLLHASTRSVGCDTLNDSSLNEGSIIILSYSATTRQHSDVGE